MKLIKEETMKFNICPNCGEKSKFKLKNNRDDKDEKERRYYCEFCCQVFDNKQELQDKKK